MLNDKIINPNVPRGGRARIKHVKSGRFLSLQGGEHRPPVDGVSLDGVFRTTVNAVWGYDNQAVTIRDWLNMDWSGSPQIWILSPCRADTYTMSNQFSGLFACIAGRETWDGARVIQYHDELIYAREPFQQWRFKPAGTYWLIQNVHSGYIIGPDGGNTDDDRTCTQRPEASMSDAHLWEFHELCNGYPFPVDE